MKKEKVMKAEKEKKCRLLDVVWKGSVQASVQVRMKGLKDKSSAHKPVIIYGMGERSCLLDGGNGIVHVKQKKWFLGMGKSSLHNSILALLNMTWRKKNLNLWNRQREAKKTQCYSGCVERMIRRSERWFLVDWIVRWVSEQTWSLASWRHFEEDRVYSCWME